MAPCASTRKRSTPSAAGRRCGSSWTSDMSLLFAVHLSDGTVLWPWQAGGFVLAALLALWGAWRITDEEIPRVALLTSAFFVVSLIHIPAGPTSAHLLLNGLVGVILGRRVCLAIPIGLLLQAVFGHGGFGA